MLIPSHAHTAMHVGWTTSPRCICFIQVAYSTLTSIQTIIEILLPMEQEFPASSFWLLLLKPAQNQSYCSGQGTLQSGTWEGRSNWNCEGPVLWAKPSHSSPSQTSLPKFKFLTCIKKQQWIILNCMSLFTISSKAYHCTLVTTCRLTFIITFTLKEWSTAVSLKPFHLCWI